jgi:hypothetical protein
MCGDNPHILWIMYVVLTYISLISVEVRHHHIYMIAIYLCTIFGVRIAFACALFIMSTLVKK